ncbi:hypothetical protein QBC34DRAFT_379160 [Podospora aff. communis PSN243]|uniref:Ubiquitin 3 binding protein But2 C-terminal domain-containing protein n=1 Tax=Podospora aff. communis PSN243 TaxID=3040156 RepID=A0AAV9GQ34_9PEZI|nr:hypothetical protein QBC34DRAFT_379160 [Podospora aff. communis PSN243]
MKLNLFHTLSLLFLAAFAAALPPSALPIPILESRQAPDTQLTPRQVSGVTITSIAFGGTGCPAGSVSASLASGASALNLGFSSFTNTFSANNKACNVAVTLNLPAGVRFAVSTARYQGSANLASGVTSSMSETHFFSGLSLRASTSATLGGAYSGGFNLNRPASTFFPACSAQTSFVLNVQVQGRLTSSVGTPGGQSASLGLLGLNLAWEWGPVLQSLKDNNTADYALQDKRFQWTLHRDE